MPRDELDRDGGNLAEDFSVQLDRHQSDFGYFQAPAFEADTIVVVDRSKAVIV